MPSVKVNAGDYDWFDVVFDEHGEPMIVRHVTTVWELGKDKTCSAMMSERTRRVIETAKKMVEDGDVPGVDLRKSDKR